MMPKVSIIIPVYNGENFIKDAVESAIGQTYKNIEVIVVDDGSSDSTRFILEPYMTKIRYFYKDNGGVSSALNYGISKMSGDYFSWLSHDDWFHKDKIFKQIEFFKKVKNPEKTVLFSDYFVVYDEYPICIHRKIRLKENFFTKKKYYSILRSQINGITAVIPKKLILQCGSFDESLKCVQDYDYWIRLANLADFRLVRSSLSYTRIHSRQDSRSRSKCSEEFNHFWISVLELVPPEIRTTYEINELLFYKKFLKFLTKTPYSEAYDYHFKEFIKLRELLRKI